MYRIKLGNGREIENVSVEGVICFSEEQLTREDFAYGLHEVRITKTSNDDTDIDVELAEGVYKDMKLIMCCPCRFKPGYVMFHFDFMTERDKKDSQVDARLDYLEMMSEEV